LLLGLPHRRSEEKERVRVVEGLAERSATVGQVVEGVDVAEREGRDRQPPGGPYWLHRLKFVRLVKGQKAES